MLSDLMRLRKKCSFFFCLPSVFRVFKTPMGGAFKPFLEITEQQATCVMGAGGGESPATNAEQEPLGFPEPLSDLEPDRERWQHYFEC